MQIKKRGKVSDECRMKEHTNDRMYLNVKTRSAPITEQGQKLYVMNYCGMIARGTSQQNERLKTHGSSNM